MTHVNLALTQAVLVLVWYLRQFWNISTAAENHFNKPIIIGTEVTQICNRGVLPGRRGYRALGRGESSGTWV